MNLLRGILATNELEFSVRPTYLPTCVCFLFEQTALQGNFFFFIFFRSIYK